MCIHMYGIIYMCSALRSIHIRITRHAFKKCAVQIIPLTQGAPHTHTHVHAFIYIIYIYIFVVHF